MRISIVWRWFTSERFDPIEATARTIRQSESAGQIARIKLSKRRITSHPLEERADDDDALGPGEEDREHAGVDERIAVGGGAFRGGAAPPRRRKKPIGGGAGGLRAGRPEGRRRGGRERPRRRRRGRGSRARR